MSEKKRVKHYVSKKTGKVFPAEEWTVGEPVDGKRSIPLDRFPLDIIYHDEKKREPLLSEFGIIEWAQEKALDMAQADDADPNWVSAYSAGLRSGMRGGRDYYERLIDEGKLIVAKEVELWHPTVPEEEWKKWLTGSDAEFSMLVTKCCGRNPWVPPWLSRRCQWDDDGTFRMTKNEFVCPGCGGKIKR